MAYFERWLIFAYENDRQHTCNDMLGDHLWAGKPSLYVTSLLGQLSIPSLQRR